MTLRTGITTAVWVAVHETEAILKFTKVQAKLFGTYHHLAEDVGNKAEAPPFKASMG